MEFSFSLNSLEKYFRSVRGEISQEAFHYNGIVIFVDDTNPNKPTIGLCIYGLDKAYNLDLLLPVKKETATKKNGPLYCPATFDRIMRPEWDIVFFSKGDWLRTLRLAKKSSEKPSIVFKGATCFPQLGNSRDGITGFSNIIMSGNHIADEAYPSPTMDYSFGKPFPPIWKDEALQIAFRLIEYKIVNNQWLINLIRKIDSLEKNTASFQAPKYLVEKDSRTSTSRGGTKTSRKSNAAKSTNKKSVMVQKVDTDDNFDILVSSGPKAPIRLKSKEELEKKKLPKKKSKKHFKINNLGFKM